MRILITGTAGFVGSHFLESVLTKTDWDVICIDSLKSWHNGNVQSTMQAMSDLRAQGRGVSHMTHDLAVPFRGQQIDFIGDVDFIANIASMSQVHASVKDPVGFIGNNVNLMLNMLELAREIAPRRMLHMSTDEVYGGGRGCGPTDHQPSSPYAASKASQEDICHSYRRSFRIPVTTVNSANMFGERQSELAFIPKVVRWIAEGTRIPVHHHGDLPGGRNYTYVRNVTNHLVSLLREDVEHVSGLYEFPSRIHLAGQEYVDNMSLVQRIGEIMNMEPYTIAQRGEDAIPGWDPMYATLRDSQDWRPTVSFDEGLVNAVEWLGNKL